jgi:AAA family ATP:ADP antiporter
MFRSLALVRAGERRNALGAFLTLFGLMTGHALLETARDALFLAHLPPSKLPWVYLAIAAVALALTGSRADDGRVRTRRAELSIWLVGSALVTLLLWTMAVPHRIWAFYALYIWTGVFATLIVIGFWSLASEYFTVTQAKRLFALIGTGSVLGAIAGSGLAQIVATMWTPRALLLCASATLAASALGPLLLTRTADGAPETGRQRAPRADAARSGEAAHPPASPALRRSFEVADSLRLVWRHPYARRLALLVLLSTVTLTMVDYLFKSWLARTVSAAQLGYVFATAYFILNCFSLLAQIALVGVLTHTLGVSRVLAILPALIAGGSLWFVAGGSLFAVLLLKAFDGSLRHSLHRTALEVLYVPLASDFRARAKNVIDVFGQRGGQALASLAILASVALGLSEIWLGAGILAISAAWIFVASNLKPHYLDLFRTSLGAGSVETRMAFPSLDLASLETLIAALGSQSDTEVVAALDLLAAQGRMRLVPGLILYHPSPRVVNHALDLFSKHERADAMPIVQRLLSHDDAHVRAEALRFAAAHGIDARQIHRALDDASPLVSATAKVCLAADDASDAGLRELMLASIRAIAQTGSTEERAALAHAIRHRPAPLFEEILLSLSEVPDPTVRLEVVHAMKEIGSDRFLPRLMLLLAHRDVRAEVRQTLIALGRPALDALARALVDESIPLRVRRHLPRTLSRLEPEPASRILLDRLPAEPDGVIRYKILRALGRLRVDNPALPLDAAVLDGATRATLRAAFQLIDWRMHLERGVAAEPARRTAVHEILAGLLHNKERHTIERLFRLLGLSHPGEDFRVIYRGTTNADRRARASSRELLENVLAPPLRDAVIALVDDLSDAERLAAAGQYYTRLSGGYDDVLRELLDRGGTTARALVAYHAGELRLYGLRDRVDRMGPDPAGLLAETIARAKAMLAAPAGESA